MPRRGGEGMGKVISFTRRVTFLEGVGIGGGGGGVVFSTRFPAYRGVGYF